MLYPYFCIKSGADALANLPSRARWFPQGDAATSATKRVARVISPPREAEGGFFMSKRKSNGAVSASSDVTSAGVPWSEVPDFALSYVEWMDGRHGPATETLPPIDQTPIPAVLLILPRLHEHRPRGSKAMIDAHGAKCRLTNCRPGAWLLSPFTGWRWAKWPTGEIGWIPADAALPDSLRVRSRDDIQ